MLRILILQLIALTFVALSASPSKLFAVISPFAFTDMLFIYLYRLYCPKAMPIWLAFTLGILRDSINGTILGGHALLNILMVLWMIKNSYHLRSTQFSRIWYHFTILASVYSLCYVTVIAWSETTFPPVTQLITEYIFTLCLYPLFHILFAPLLEHNLDEQHAR